MKGQGWYTAQAGRRAPFMAGARARRRTGSGSGVCGSRARLGGLERGAQGGWGCWVVWEVAAGRVDFFVVEGG